MASFAGPARDTREYEVVYPDDPCQAGTRVHHVRLLDGSTSLCGHGCSFLDGWSTLADAHPEDVAEDLQCRRCYSALAARHRRARGERRAPRKRQARCKVQVTVAKASEAARIRQLVKVRDERLEATNREIADAIRAANEDGVPMRELADALGMSRQAAYLFLERF